MFWEYIEFHIEQGPVLENLGRPLGVVEAIRWNKTVRSSHFQGKRTTRARHR